MQSGPSVSPEVPCSSLLFIITSLHWPSVKALRYWIAVRDMGREGKAAVLLELCQFHWRVLQASFLMQQGLNTIYPHTITNHHQLVLTK